MVLSLAKIFEEMNSLEDKEIPIAYKMGKRTQLTDLTVASFIEAFGQNLTEDPDSPLQISLHHPDNPSHNIVGMGVANNIWFFLVQEIPSDQLH